MKFRIFTTQALFIFALWVSAQPSSYDSFYVDNGGVKIHCVAKGSGPVMLFLHGFPDFWFTWYYQMERFADSGYRVVGMDLRGYNLSDKPQGVDSYNMSALISDALAVINAVSPNDRVILVANDWGGAIAWQIATWVPQKVKYLIACNIPHPTSLFRHLSERPETGSYTKAFTADDALSIYTEEKLLEMTGVEDAEMKGWYSEAFSNSSIESMLNYYKVSYPKPSGANSNTAPVKKIQCPILMIHGLKDTAFPPPVLNDHWEYAEGSFSLYTLPKAGHFVQRDASEEVYSIIDQWLKLQNKLGR